MSNTKLKFEEAQFTAEEILIMDRAALKTIEVGGHFIAGWMTEVLPRIKPRHEAGVDLGTVRDYIVFRIKHFMGVTRENRD